MGSKDMDYPNPIPGITMGLKKTLLKSPLRSPLGSPLRSPPTVDLEPLNENKDDVDNAEHLDAKYIKKFPYENSLPIENEELKNREMIKCNFPPGEQMELTHKRQRIFMEELLYADVEDKNESNTLKIINEYKYERKTIKLNKDDDSLNKYQDKSLQERQFNDTTDKVIDRSDIIDTTATGSAARNSNQWSTNFTRLLDVDACHVVKESNNEIETKLKKGVAKKEIKKDKNQKIPMIFADNKIKINKNGNAELTKQSKSFDCLRSMTDPLRVNSQSGKLPDLLVSKSLPNILQGEHVVEQNRGQNLKKSIVISMRNTDKETGNINQENIGSKEFSTAQLYRLKGPSAERKAQDGNCSTASKDLAEELKLSIENPKSKTVCFHEPLNQLSISDHFEDVTHGQTSPSEEIQMPHRSHYIGSLEKPSSKDENHSASINKLLNCLLWPRMSFRRSYHRKSRREAHSSDAGERLSKPSSDTRNKGLMPEVTVTKVLETKVELPITVTPFKETDVAETRPSIGPSVSRRRKRLGSVQMRNPVDYLIENNMEEHLKLGLITKEDVEVYEWKKATGN
ncbi:unnamed protein product [Rotaria magnacalcarata]|uniref:Uncharacterized protein n=1 Tax=Rotaria magnacalcarata TaxID=392030 RepID=A0A817AE28_9BILA|nr:unnamed protein product [Rotaria magnacalcarata]CAF4193608.1 unnamed protein product [Rotaria magnacalcarata]